MNQRLLEIIKYKTGGRQIDFSKLLGWTPQYLAKLLRGEALGLSPVIRLLESLPEINARWFLLGEGEMLNEGKLTSLRREALSRVQSILDMDRYIPVMRLDELRQFEEAIAGGKLPNYDNETIAKWESRLISHNKDINTRIAAATAKSDELCRQRTARK